MPALRTSQVIPLPPPYRGQMDRIPVTALQDPYCEVMMNFNVSEGGVSLRHGDQSLARYASFANEKIHCIAWIDSLAQWWVVTGGNVGNKYTVYNYTGSTTLATIATFSSLTDTFVMCLQFGGYVYFFGNNSLSSTHKGIYFNGAAWAATPYTVSFNPIIGEAHRNRMYLVADDNTQTIGYGIVNGVTGTITSYSLSGVLPSSSPIYFIKSFSISDTQTTKNLLAVGTRSGHIVVYDGSYPASSDWQVVGRFKVPEISYYQSLIEYNGDALLITRSGLISLRDLFLKGSQGAIDQAISAPITKRWKEIMKVLYSAYNQALIHGVWDEANNRILIGFVYYVVRDSGTSGTTPFWLVYDIERQAWSEHRQYNQGEQYALAYGNGAVFYGEKGNLFKKEGKSDYLDDYYSGSNQLTARIPFKLRSAPIPTAKVSNSKMTGMEMISQGDFYQYAKVRLRGDLGAKITGDTTLGSVGSSMCKPFLNVGIDATTVQWELEQSGSSMPSDGANIYGVNIHFDQGGVR